MQLPPYLTADQAKQFASEKYPNVRIDVALDFLSIQNINSLIPGTLEVVNELGPPLNNSPNERWDKSFLELLSPELRASLVAKK